MADKGEERRTLAYYVSATIGRQTGSEKLRPRIKFSLDVQIESYRSD
jgi:hypothetical protein